MKPTSWFSAGSVAVLGLTGCPLTDDYFIAGEPVPAGGSGGVDAAGGQAGRAFNGGTGGNPGTGGAPCVKRTERCNGHDDDCNGSVDELACNNAICTGFVLSPDSTHGYMFCSERKTWAQAKAACAAQDMLLAAIESVAENSELGGKLAALTKDTEVTFGANDQTVEGDWVWDGGTQFWKGSQTGVLTGGFVAWANASPDNYGNNEDCGVMNPSAATWADRSCAGSHVYICEDKAP